MMSGGRSFGVLGVMRFELMWPNTEHKFMQALRLDVLLSIRSVMAVLVFQMGMDAFLKGKFVT